MFGADSRIIFGNDLRLLPWFCSSLGFGSSSWVVFLTINGGESVETLLLWFSSGTELDTSDGVLSLLELAVDKAVNNESQRQGLNPVVYQNQ